MSATVEAVLAARRGERGLTIEQVAAGVATREFTSQTST
jgi:hypothetical protein